MIRTVMRLAALTVLGVVLVTPGIAAAHPDSAAANPKEPTVAAVVAAPEPRGAHSCDSGDFCAYYLSNYAGGVYAWAGNDGDWRNNILPNGASIDNDDMSWRNRGTACAGCDAVRVFDGVNFAAPRTICLTRGQSVAFNPGAANRGSSHSWYGGC